MSRSATPALDRIDRALLRELQADATQTAASLSEKVALSPTAVLRRIERLRTDGLIRATVALLDPEQLDLPTLVVVGVVLDRSTPDSFEAFETAARSLSGCLECHLVAGEFDYFMMFRTRDLQRFTKLHAGEILRLPGVRQIRTFFVLKEILSTTALPV